MTAPSHAKDPQVKKSAPERKSAAPVRGAMDSISFKGITAVIENPDVARPEEILQLQRLAGNRAVTHLLQTKAGMEGDDETLQPKFHSATLSPKPDSASGAQPSAGVLTPPGPAAKGVETGQPATATIAPKTLNIQAKLMVSQPGDQQEVEADQVSEQIMKMPGRATPPPPDDENKNNNQNRPAILNRYLQRQQIQGASDGIGGNAVSDDVQGRIEKMHTGGRPLPASEREFFEPRMGVDLGNVRIHTDSEATDTSKELNARAYTVGPHVAFNSGEFQPGTTEGRKLLGHELTHVVQQGGAGELKRKVSLQPVLQKFSLPPSLNLSSPKIQAPIIQKSGFFDDAKKFVGDVGNKASEMGGKIVKAGSEFLSMGFNSFAELVAHFAPQLADLIKKGPLAILTEKIQEALQTWIQTVFGDIDIASVVGELYEVIGIAFESINLVVNGSLKGGKDCASCAKFTENLNKLSTFAEKLLNSPVIKKLQERFTLANAAFTKVTELLIAPVFDSVMKVAGNVLKEIKGFADQVWAWTAPVRNALAAAWDWVKAQLGMVQDGANGVLEWLKEKATEAWKAIQEKLAPVMGPIKTIGMVLGAFTPVGWFVIATQVVPQVVEMVKWLWANKDNPKIIESAHEEMGHTILPQLLTALQGFGQNLSSAVTSFGAKVTELGTAVVSLFQSISGIPIFASAKAFIGGMAGNVQQVRAWVDTTWKSVVKGVQSFAASAEETLRPFIGVLVQIGTAIAFPPAIPGIFAGEFWLRLDDCYKGPIIDFLLKSAINFLETVPDLPIFGPMWAIAKAGVLGFLRGLFDKDTDTKVKVANKIAEILSCRNLDFMGGFLKGFLKGIWEGITDPFVTIYNVVKGLGDLVGWFGDASTQTAQKQEKPTEENVNAGQGATKGNDADAFNMAEFSTMTKEMGDELSEPVNTVTENFQPAVQEALGGAGGETGNLTFESLMSKLGEIGTSILQNIESVGGTLADKLCEFFTSEEADNQLGETLGWWAGTISFEIILAALTSGAWTPVSTAGKLLKTFARVLDWTSEVMGEAFRALSKIGGLLLDALKGIKKLFGKAGGAIAEVFGAFDTIGNKLIEFAERLIKRFTKGPVDKIVGDAVEDLAKYGDEGAALIAKYGDQAKTILTKHGDEGFHILSKHGDDVPQLINKLGGDDEFGRLINELGGGEGFSALYSKFDSPEHFLKMLDKVPDAKQLNRLVSLPKITNINQLDELLDKFTSPSQLERLLKLDKVADADSLLRLVNLVDDPIRLGGLINLTDDSVQLEKLLKLIGGSPKSSELENLLRLAGQGNSKELSALLEKFGDIKELKLLLNKPGSIKELAKLLDSNQIRKNSELFGGHFNDEHVGRTIQQLTDRLNKPENNWMHAASSFKSVEEANLAIETVFQNKVNRMKLAEWLSNGKPQLILTEPFIGGDVLTRNATNIVSGSKAKILLRIKSNEWYVHTGYPEL